MATRVSNIVFICVIVFTGCRSDDQAVVENDKDFFYGADLSYVNQILDHQGVYKDQNEVRSPYRIFKDHGTNLVRLRLWNNPQWTKEVYGTTGTQLYNDLHDVEKAMRLSKQQGMQMLLDFHYSDSWADPGKQEIPEAWRNISSLDVLKDSVYQYTLKTLTYLDKRGLMPDFVQIGNETNCGMMYTDASSSFPKLNGCEGNWANLGAVINSAAKAVRDASAKSSTKPRTIIHVADPKNVEYYLDNIIGEGAVSDFDIVGVSFYPIWHTTVSPENLSTSITTFRTKYKRDVMILETAYPWTKDHADDYHNLWGGEPSLPGFPYTVEGQTAMMKRIVQEVKDGGGIGVIYWEPAWITSSMKDKWGTGSSWENNTFFDFEGNVLPSIDYPQAK